MNLNGTGILLGVDYFVVVNVCVRVSQAIADMVTEENLAEGRLYPPLSTIREVSFKIAVKVADGSWTVNVF